MASLILWIGIHGPPHFRQSEFSKKIRSDRHFVPWIPDFEFGYLSVGENIRRHFDSSTSLVLRKNRKVATNIVSQSILRIYNEMLVTNVANGCWWRMSVMDVGDDLLSPISKDWCQPRSGCHQNRQWECKYLTRNSFNFILNNFYLICTLSGLNMPLILAVVID